jgi:PadR family transcriptional regulator PadR
MQPPEDRWPAEWLRGVLELCTLAVLLEGPAHGYAIAQQLESAGLGQIKGGTLYPLLTRLETAGLLTSAWEAGGAGPGRKVFAVTEQGRAERVRRAEHYHRFTDLTRVLVGAPVSAP